MGARVSWTVRRSRKIGPFGQTVHKRGLSTVRVMPTPAAFVRFTHTRTEGSPWNASTASARPIGLGAPEITTGLHGKAPSLVG
jgi:hypothetical protein